MPTTNRKWLLRWPPFPRRRSALLLPLPSTAVSSVKTISRFYKRLGLSLISPRDAILTARVGKPTLPRQVLLLPRGPPFGRRWPTNCELRLAKPSIGVVNAPLSQ